MEIDLNKKLALNFILGKMIEWESENLVLTRNPNFNSLEDYVTSLQDEIKKGYSINLIDYSMLIKKLEIDGHINIFNELQIKVNIGAIKFLSNGGYTQNKYIVWAKNPDNTWKIILAIAAGVFAIYRAKLL